MFGKYHLLNAGIKKIDEEPVTESSVENAGLIPEILISMATPDVSAVKCEKDENIVVLDDVSGRDMAHLSYYKNIWTTKNLNIPKSPLFTNHKFSYGMIEISWCKKKKTVCIVRMKGRKKKKFEYLQQRIHTMLYAASALNADTLIIGPETSMATSNMSEAAARLFKEYFKNNPGNIKRVIFALPDNYGGDFRENIISFVNMIRADNIC